MSDSVTPTAVLRDQHRKILEVADVIEEIVSPDPVSGSLDYDALEDCVRFVRLYADALHHGKEEDLLFPEMEAQGVPGDHGPIAVMLQEHRDGRTLVEAMARALPAARQSDTAARRRLVNAALGYVSLIRSHILKENHVLFDMADQLIGGDACRALCAAYDGVCQRRFDGCTVTELEGILARLLERYPRSDAE